MWLKQTIAVTIQSLQGLQARRGNSLVALVGVAGVVLVFVGVLSMAQGFSRTLAAAGDARNVMVLRSGSSSELDSTVSGEQMRIIRDAPGIASDAEGPLVSGEFYAMMDLDKKSSQTPANVPLRGVQPQALKIRDRVEVVAGRWFELGKREIVAGVGAFGQFEGLAVGSELKMGEQSWTVVGHFSADGGIFESELWSDVRVLQGAYRRGNNFNVVNLRLASEDDFQELKDTLDADPRLSARVVSEPEYFAEQSAVMSALIKYVGYVIAILMALGAVFGAINTMYTSVSERTREIATLRALGFANSSIVVSRDGRSRCAGRPGWVVGRARGLGVF